MSRFFYFRLARTNIKNNAQIYIPYVLTCLMCIAMFYIMIFLSTNESLETMNGGMQLRIILTLGSIVIGIFASIILLYTNSFIMKRRKREIGLFNILGMGKKHIAKVMSLELFCIAVLTIVFGMGIGILFSKLMLLLLARVMDFPVVFGFEISVPGIIASVILFAVIFSITLIGNLRRVHVAQPIELLHGSSTGEKEPKVKWLLTLIGISSLGGGYYIAITTEKPISAILLFFVAVILVILGTYCLFTAGSIALLKLMKRKKNYYYKTKHFTSVSGMIYRMKQNAVGLANICILSTMVLVMVSTTTCLFAGLEDSLRSQYPHDLSIQASARKNNDYSEIGALVRKVMSDSEYEMQNVLEFTLHADTFEQDGNKFIYNGAGFDVAEEELDNKVILTLIPLPEYNNSTKPDVKLETDEILVYSSTLDFDMSQVYIKDQCFRVKEVIDELQLCDIFYEDFVDVFYFIFSDEEVIKQLYEEMMPGSEWEGADYYLGFDIDCLDEEQIDVYTEVRQTVAEYNDVNKMSFSVSSAAIAEKDFKSLYGGLFFLGILLGIIFIMATVLIMYYKQISEGYEDQKRFEIMQKVGMSRNEVKKTIKSQVLLVFFLPLVAACIHVAAAFKMIVRLFVVFGMTNEMLFLGCTVGTVVVFALVYTGVYILTARAYYRIVSK